jgi:hypothetical protein
MSGSCRSNIDHSTVNAKKARSARDEKSSTEHKDCLSQLRDKYRVKISTRIEIDIEFRELENRL